jgi:anaerobic selenocysteine-containing dehydrogenase
MKSVRPAVNPYRLAYPLQRTRNEWRRAPWNPDFSV